MYLIKLISEKLRKTWLFEIANAATLLGYGYIDLQNVLYNSERV